MDIGKKFFMMRVVRH